MIGIIDYGMGNLRSVQKAFEHVGAQARILSDPEQVRTVDRLVLPGVGAFADGMEHLRRLGYVAALQDFRDSGKPLLGICLGLQLLFDSSEEDAPNTGLSMLPGRVVKFAGDAYGPGRLKVPHMGWNVVRWRTDDPLFAGLEPGASFYFVHSYYPRPDDSACISGVCDYGVEFCATIWRDNLWATQFHPEKSQAVGLKMLANFARL